MLDEEEGVQKQNFGKVGGWGVTEIGNGNAGLTERKDNETGLGRVNETVGHLSGDICSLKERLD